MPVVKRKRRAAGRGRSGKAPGARPGAAPRAPRETQAARLARAARLLETLKGLYPDADCALRHGNAFELLIATILSAQSTDVNVNRVTPGLFARFPDASAFARADQEEVEELIHSTGFFRQKAKNVIGASRRIVEAFGGQVPERMEDLVTLPGVARKTANVVLGTWFKKNEGIVVDTHVGRLAHRLGLTWTSKGEKDAVRIEQDLQQVIPHADWTFFSHAMILHGRSLCPARKPRCVECPLASNCPAGGREVARGASS